MIRLGEIRGAKGSTHKVKRLGRGVGSGKGNTSGKGHKGLLARKGGGRRPGYEGGQTPLFRRIPKRGFHNFTKKEYLVLNLGDLDAFKGKEISLETLRESGRVPSRIALLKVLGKGELKKAVTLKAHSVSETAKAKIEKAGGKVEVL
jgi:large subunit ribosomal protein L15